MRDPYLYDDIDVLKNLGNIKNSEILHKAEADITNLSMTAIYNVNFDKFDTKTLQEIHSIIFGQIFDWAGEFRTIQITKYEDILGGDSVRYTHPKEIKKSLNDSMKDIGKLKCNGTNDRDIIFRLVRIIAQIWQIHPFREGNTRSIIVFSVLFAKSLGLSVQHNLFKIHSSYVRNSLVWASQGIYSKPEYLERIFFDAILDDNLTNRQLTNSINTNYESIGNYKIKDYIVRPHEYLDENK